MDGRLQPLEDKIRVFIEGLAECQGEKGLA